MGLIKAIEDQIFYQALSLEGQTVKKRSKECFRW